VIYARCSVARVGDAGCAPGGWITAWIPVRDAWTGRVVRLAWEHPGPRAGDYVVKSVTTLHADELTVAACREVPCFGPDYRQVLTC
jgi:hypothetical protein